MALRTDGTGLHQVAVEKVVELMVDALPSEDEGIKAVHGGVIIEPVIVEPLLPGDLQRQPVENLLPRLPPRKNNKAHPVPRIGLVSIAEKLSNWRYFFASSSA